MRRFNKPKYQALGKEQQQKILADLARRLYLAKRDDASTAVLEEEYNELASWLSLPPLKNCSGESLADLYHYHLQNAGIHVREPNFLPNIRQGDRIDYHPSCLPVSVYLDNLRSAHNVGSIIRTVEAFALGTIYFSKNTPFITNKQVTATAMNSAHWVACQQVRSLDELPRPVIALETSEQATPLADFSFPPIFTLAVGNEEYGCSRELLAMVDACIEIPLYGRKNSLNVSNAFAIAAASIRNYNSIKT